MRVMMTMIGVFLISTQFVNLAAGMNGLSKNNDIESLRMLTVGIQHLMIWRSNHLNIININKPHNHIIIAPCYFHLKKKILFAKNGGIGENRGDLQVMDYNANNIETIHSGKAIRSPVISKNDNKVAFLSDRDSNGYYSLMVIDLQSGNRDVIVNSVVGEGYNLNISWHPNNLELLYTDKNRDINLINISTKCNKVILSGYDPIFSPDGDRILFRNTIKKPYTPYVYNINTNSTIKVKLRRIYNAVWMPDGQKLAIVKSKSKISNWNEWEKEVLIYDLENKNVQHLFHYEGFEYLCIGCN